jgi:molybdate transport system permease protein
MSPEIWRTLLLSVQIAIAATLLALAVAVPLAYINARARYAGKSVVEALIVLPLVLPPTVVGYLLIVGMGAHGIAGSFLRRWFEYSIMFRFEGAMLAAAIVALPLLYLPTRSGFASIDRELEDNARVIGANRAQLFWHVSLPMVRRSLISGLMLAFARALGEFGATVMVFGIRPGHTTLPVSIYLDYEHGEMRAALPAVLMLCALSLAITLFYNRSALSKQE